MTSKFVSISTSIDAAAVCRNSPSRTMRRIRQIAAATTALTFMLQNLAWATCSDNITQFPPVASNPGGFTFGSAPLSTFVGAGTFTNTLGSVWVPDTSVFEHNDPHQPATNGGHEWVFDQGTTTCKITDVGLAGGTPTSWSIPTVVAPDCFFLPVVGGTTTITITLNGKPVQISMPLIRGITDVPQRNDVLTPTCDPTKLTLAADTFLNHLGCSISHGVPTDAAHATSYMFTSGIRSGLSVVPLVNTSGAAGGDAGKVATRGSDLYTASSVLNQKLDTAVISRDGQFLFGASSKNGPNVYACQNPLGDPTAGGFPVGGPINPFFAVPPAATVKCVQIGNAQQSRVLGMAMGSDGQLYMANNANVTTFTGFPACLGPLFANGGPPCTSVVNDTLSLGPGIKAETQAFVSHGDYLYRAIKGGPVSQFKLAVDSTGATTVTPRNYAVNLPNVTGIGFSNTLNAMLAYGDPSGIGAPGAEVVVQLPICEDIP